MTWVNMCLRGGGCGGGGRGEEVMGVGDRWQGREVTVVKR